MSKSIGLPKQISEFVFQAKCMQDIDKSRNAKQMSKSKGLPNQISGFVFQTKFMPDMDEQEANAKLVLGTTAFPNQIQDFCTKPKACRTWMGKGQTRSWF